MHLVQRVAERQDRDLACLGTYPARGLSPRVLQVVQHPYLLRLRVGGNAKYLPEALPALMPARAGLLSRHIDYELD